MRRFIVMLFFFVALHAESQIVFDKPVNLTLDWSSYGTGSYVLGAAYLESWAVNMHPQFTNHTVYVGGSGEATQFQFQTLQEKRNLPPWAVEQGCTNVDIVLANDNGSYDFNTTTNWMTQLFGAPPLFYNGTAVTNEGLSIPVYHLATGRIPADTGGGDSGSINGNAGSMAVNTNFGTAKFDMWHFLHTNGLLTVTGDFYPFGHPQPPGSFGIAMGTIVMGNFETNAGSIKFDFSNATATTNNWTASGITVSGLSISATVRAIRAPMSVETADGNLRTNDVRNAFAEFPALGGYMTWTISVTNLPSGNYVGSFDGVPFFTNTAAGWAVGCNLFTNYSTGWPHSQQMAVLNKIRDAYGVDPYTLVATHNAGQNGVLGTQDLINYLSLANQQYDTFGLRGSNYVAAMASCVTNGLYSYDYAKYQAAQQTNHLFTLQQAAPNMRANSLIFSLLKFLDQWKPSVVQKPVTNYLHFSWVNDRPQWIDSWLVESSTNLTDWTTACVNPREIYYAPETKPFEVFRVRPIDPVTWYQPGHDYPGQVMLTQQELNDYCQSNGFAFSP